MLLATIKSKVSLTVAPLPSIISSDSDGRDASNATATGSDSGVGIDAKPSR